MTSLELATEIAAPPEVCFDLARDVRFHAESLGHTGERVLERPEHDLLRLGDEVELEGRHFGVRQRLRARIDAFDRPGGFTDVMVRGPFSAFCHDHVFEATPGGTLMRDRIHFTAPGILIGRLIERTILKPYLSRILAVRAEAIRRRAEGARATPSS